MSVTKMNVMKRRVLAYRMWTGHPALELDTERWVNSKVIMVSGGTAKSAL